MKMEITKFETTSFKDLELVDLLTGLVVLYADSRTKRYELYDNRNTYDLKNEFVRAVHTLACLAACKKQGSRIDCNNVLAEETITAVDYNVPDFAGIYEIVNFSGDVKLSKSCEGSDDSIVSMPVAKFDKEKVMTPTAFDVFWTSFGNAQNEAVSTKTVTKPVLTYPQIQSFIKYEDDRCLGYVLNDTGDTEQLSYLTVLARRVEIPMFNAFGKRGTTFSTMKLTGALMNSTVKRSSVEAADEK